jgi:hypothetical protein
VRHTLRHTPESSPTGGGLLSRGPSVCTVSAWRSEVACRVACCAVISRMCRDTVFEASLRVNPGTKSQNSNVV